MRLECQTDGRIWPFSSDRPATKEAGCEETAGESPGEADDIDPRQAKTATMRLSPGKYVFGHYVSGMRGQLIVR